MFFYNEGDPEVSYTLPVEPSIVTEGLQLHLDAGDANSYPGTGTTWYDLSGNGYNGTLQNGVGFDSDGGGSLSFDGSNDYVSVGALSGQFNSFTVMAWFKPFSVTNYENVLDCNYSSYSVNVGPRLEMESSGRLAWVAMYSGLEALSSGLLQNVWSSTTLTYDSGTYSRYYNSNLSQQTNHTTHPGAMNDIIIGKGYRLGGTERNFTGLIPNVMVYNRALSQEEVLQNFNATKTRFGL